MLNALLVPRGVIAWPARLLLWCGLAFFAYVLVKSAFGLPVHYGWDFIVISAVVAPLLGLTMAGAKARDHDMERLTEDARTDTLTGLLNRRGFTEAVSAAGDGVLLIVDIDHFKHVNDRYGHAAGDAVLRAMSAHLTSNTRSTDLVGRLGGEEFAIFLKDLDSLEVDRIGARLCEGFILYNQDVPAPIKVTMSVGAAFSAMARTKSDTYLNADQALYQAKRSGRARLAFWQPPVTTRH